jgi:hypothetical protein
MPMGVDATRLVEHANSGEAEVENLLGSLRSDPACEKEEGLSIAHPIGQFLSLPPENRRQFTSRDIDVVDRRGNRVDGGRLDGEREFCSRGIDDGAASGREFENASSLIFSARDAALVDAEVGGPNSQDGEWNE